MPNAPQMPSLQNNSNLVSEVFGQYWTLFSSPQPSPQCAHLVWTSQEDFQTPVQLWLLLPQLLSPSTHNWSRTIPPPLVQVRSRLAGPQTLWPSGSRHLLTDNDDRLWRTLRLLGDVTAPLGGWSSGRWESKIWAKWFPHFYLWSPNTNNPQTWPRISGAEISGQYFQKYLNCTSSQSYAPCLTRLN